MSASPRLILASGSAIRAAILKNAGVAFDVVKPDVDERALQRRMAGASLEAVAEALADAKALAVRAPGAFVLGSDQILEHRGAAYDKPASLAQAAERLAVLQGEAHSLINAVAIARDGEIRFRFLARPVLHMRALSRDDITRYLDRAGADVLQSVGAYQVEGLGAQLFDRIEGDYFAVLGLSLLPVLSFLRTQGFVFP